MTGSIALVDLPAGEFVVKPSVGAGSTGVGRFGPAARPAARSHTAALHDVVPAPGGLVVLELELIEPSLFLRQSEMALERLADGLSRRLT